MMSSGVSALGQFGILSDCWHKCLTLKEKFDTMNREMINHPEHYNSDRLIKRGDNHES